MHHITDYGKENYRANVNLYAFVFLISRGSSSQDSGGDNSQLNEKEEDPSRSMRRSFQGVSRIRRHKQNTMWSICPVLATNGLLRNRIQTNYVSLLSVIHCTQRFVGFWSVIIKQKWPKSLVKSMETEEIACVKCNYDAYFIYSCKYLVCYQCGEFCVCLEFKVERDICVQRVPSTEAADNETLWELRGKLN